MFLVGLTGGIAAGKSTVAKRWVELGAKEIDADVLARIVVEPGTPGLAEIANKFGKDVLNADGSLNRANLGALVFNNPAKLATLNEIIHPLVKDLSKHLISIAQDDEIIIYNVPLLVEAKVDHSFDFIVTVEAPIETQIERLTKNRGLSKEDAISIINNQAKPVERAAKADVILNSNQDLHLLLRDADELWREIERRAAAKRNG